MFILPKCLSLYFHSIEVKEFERLIKWLKKRGYVFISLKQLLHWYSNDLPHKNKLCYISFDDGKRSNLELLPICEKYNVPITVFVTTSALHTGNFWWEYVYAKYGKFEEFKSYDYGKFTTELYALRSEIKLERTALTIDELKLLGNSSFVTIASHTVSHPILTKLPSSLLEKELYASKKELEELLNVDIYAFSYPNGSYGEREVIEASKYYNCAFSTEAKYPMIGDDIMQIPRIALTGQFYRNIIKIYRLWQPLKKVLEF